MKRMWKPLTGVALSVALLVSGLTVAMTAGATEPDKTNIANGKTAYASSEYPGGQYGAGAAFDGNMETRWSYDPAEVAPEGIQYPCLAVDLGKTYSLSGLKVMFEGYSEEAYLVKVQIADGDLGDGWKVPYDEEDSNWTDWNTEYWEEGLKQDLEIEQTGSARYVRLVFKEGSKWPTLWEMEVYGDEAGDATTTESTSTSTSESSTTSSTQSTQPESPVNVALTGTASASSQFDDSYPAAKAIDGVASTDSRWAAKWDSWSQNNEWLQVDLGKAYDISSMKIIFDRYDEQVYSFKVETSNDGSSWTTYDDSHFEEDKSGTKALKEDAVITKAATARYVRVTFAKGQDFYQFPSVQEFEIYGVEAATQPSSSSTDSTNTSETVSTVSTDSTASTDATVSTDTTASTDTTDSTEATQATEDSDTTETTEATDTTTAVDGDDEIPQTGEFTGYLAMALILAGLATAVATLSATMRKKAN